MTMPVQDMDNRVAAYEAAFEELWQQTCLGRFSVAEVKERLLALRERFGEPAAPPAPERLGRVPGG